MEYKGKIKFFEDETEVLYPEDFNLCIKKISEMIGLEEEEMLEKISLYYNDEEGDKVILNEKDDYEMFINYLKENKKNLVTLVIEIKEQSENLVNKISKEFIDYKEKHSEEINNLNKNELENNEEIINKINNIDINNDKINNDKININKNKEEKKDNMNQINYDILDYDYDELNEILINNNNNNHNKINANDIDNIKNDNDFAKKNDVKSNHSISYPETCKFCKANPLYDIFYFCTKCNYVMCSNCEKEKGTLDIHPIFKIQTLDQYMNSDLKLEKNIVNHLKGYGDVLKGVVTSITDIFQNKKNDDNNENNNINRNNYNKNPYLNNKDNKNNNNININLKNNNDNNKIEDKNNYIALAQEIKSNYALDNISLEKVEEALKLNNGDIIKALQSLFI